MGKTQLRLMAETRNFIAETCHRRRSLSTCVWIHDLSQQVCHIHHSDSVLHYGERLQVDHKKVQVTQMWKIKTGTQCLDIFLVVSLNEWILFLGVEQHTIWTRHGRRKYSTSCTSFLQINHPGEILQSVQSQNQQLQSEDVKLICSCL